MIKKIIYSILAISTFAIGTCLPVNADSPGFGAGSGRDIGVVGVGQNDSIGSEPKALTIIRTTINWILSILGVIALILCLYGGFLMLTAAGDDNKVKTGTKILKNAAIGLVVIGLSWIIVRFVFRLILEMNNRSA